MKLSIFIIFFFSCLVNNNYQFVSATDDRGNLLNDEGFETIGEAAGKLFVL